MSVANSAMPFGTNCSTPTDQTPPRREFALNDAKLKGKSLFDLQLTPSSVFYIRFLTEALNGKTCCSKTMLFADIGINSSQFTDTHTTRSVSQS